MYRRWDSRSSFLTRTRLLSTCSIRRVRYTLIDLISLWAVNCKSPDICSHLLFSSNLFLSPNRVGWDHSLALTPYGDRFRNIRKLFHRLIGARNSNQASSWFRRSSMYIDGATTSVLGIRRKGNPKISSKDSR